MSVHTKLRESAYDVRLPYDAPGASKEEKKKVRQAYQEERYRLELEFKNDLLAEYGVTDNPKAEKAYSIAWSMGHACGYAEVVSYFEDIVELIK